MVAAKLQKREASILFLVPAMVTLLGITVFPLLYELRLAFSSWELTISTESEFVGFQNFIDIVLSDKRFWSSMRVTAILMVVGACIGLALVRELVVWVWRGRKKKEKPRIAG